MVFQAHQPIRIWGKAIAGASVNVRFLDREQTVRADEDGNWLARLSPVKQYLTTGNPLTVTSASDQLAINNVLVGEVWLCAGQSNMEWPLSKTESGQAAIRDADHQQMRLLSFTGAARGGGGIYGATQLASLTPENFGSGHWQVANSETIRDFSGVGYYFAETIRKELNCPIGIINIAIGGTPIESWIATDHLASHETLNEMLNGNWLNNPTLGTWCQERARFNLQRGIAGELDLPGDEFGPNHSFKPGFMHAASVFPIQPMSIRGVIWYQGESNALTNERVKQYPDALELLIKSWREGFQNSEMPMGVVQLPAMGRDPWPLFRELQRRSTSNIANVGMAVTIDTGHPTNVHPAQKKPVGERLAKWALATIYQTDQRKYSLSPQPSEVSRNRNSIMICFDGVGEGLQSIDGSPLRHFEVCGEDGIFRPAFAKIVAKNTVAVSSPAVPDPRNVRYAWIAYPEPAVNLYNSDKMPASPFSTESNEALFGSN